MGEKAFRPAEVFHPSEYIADEMNARSWDKFDLSARMGGDPHRNLLMLDIYFAVGPTHGNCRIGDVMANQLAVAFDVSPQFFLNLERAWLDHPNTAGPIDTSPPAPVMGGSSDGGA